MKPIEKLPSGSTSKDGIWWESHPTKSDIIEKVEEIIDAVNRIAEILAKLQEEE